MQRNPDFAAFAAAYQASKPQVVSTALVADMETPVSAYLKLCGERPFSALFESVEGGATIGRYSFIVSRPDLIWRCRERKAEINRKARYDLEAFEPYSDDPLGSLRELVRSCRIELPSHLPPMAAGLIGFMGYDTVRLMERLPNENQAVLDMPDGFFMRPTIVAVFDRVEDLITLCTPVWPSGEASARAAYGLAMERLTDVVADFDRALPPQRGGAAEIEPLPEDAASNLTQAQYEAMVNKAKDYILAGDAFQIVLSQRFSVPFLLSPFALYRALRRLNPSPFLVYGQFGDFSVVASSPEILVRLRGDQVTIRPLAGTRRRGQNSEEDLALADELLADPKERAEHLMLLDLGRNDVGRVSTLKSVRVTEQFVIERYSHVMHIVSNVEGRLREGFEAIDALVAGFPAGTLSGAPKVRAMEIIEELEPDRRGLYGGCIGYFGANGDMDSCIALRTAVVKDGTMYVQAGAGVVADSNPESEYRECQHKARALFCAAEEAVRFANRQGN
ncbi:MAG: anthranilate synthase component I [Rhodospirillales bacterium]|nr:anthranilate synthase component I [Rhodospirillales bacterium]